MPPRMSSCHPAVYRALTVTSSVESQAGTVTLTAQVRKQPRKVLEEGMPLLPRHLHCPQQPVLPLSFVEGGRKLGKWGATQDIPGSILFPRGAGIGLGGLGPEPSTPPPS